MLGTQNSKEIRLPDAHTLHAHKATVNVKRVIAVECARDFPGGAVVKNLPANAGDTGSSPGPGRSHMPQSN